VIRIILVDDHALVRDGVGRLLEVQTDMQVIGSFGESATAIPYAAGHRPDVAIVDIAIPHDNGIDITRSLRQVSPSTRVLVLSMHSNAEYVHQALLAGALGYVAKESAGEVLVKAVRAVNAGERFLCSESEAQLASPLAHRAAPATLLSAREHEVLRYTVEGLTIAETAIRLGISPKSVETYRSRLMTKLGIDGLPALVKFAIRNGITDLE
jgi:DNA-binding NarL/FixJ family response regulator